MEAEDTKVRNRPLVILPHELAFRRAPGLLERHCRMPVTKHHGDVTVITGAAFLRKLQHRSELLVQFSADQGEVRGFVVFD